MLPLETIYLHHKFEYFYCSYPILPTNCTEPLLAQMTLIFNSDKMVMMKQAECR